MLRCYIYEEQTSHGFQRMAFLRYPRNFYNNVMFLVTDKGQKDKCVHYCGHYIPEITNVRWTRNQNLLNNRHTECGLCIRS